MGKVNFKNQFLVHLSTVAVPKYGNRSWVNIQSAHWVSIRSVSTNSPSDHAALLGYLSGAAKYSGVDILQNADTESLYLWMDVYCSNNPLQKIYIGADSLFTELEKKQH